MYWYAKIYYYKLTVMKSATPAVNIIIATLYLLMLIAIGYIVKLIFRISQPPAAQSKYSANNINKGLNSPLMQKNISPLFILFKSFIYKYSVVGTFINTNKCYLFKQLFILAVITVACCTINWITLWPVALAILFSIVFFVFMEYFKLPFSLNISPKVEEQQKADNQLQQEQYQIEPGMIIPKHNNYMKNQNEENKNKNIPKLALDQNRQRSEQQMQQQLQRQVQTSRKSREVLNESTLFFAHFSWKYVGVLAGLSFCTLVLVSQAMLTIYNSISNLGPLNFGSVVCVILIDQALCRPALGGMLMLVAKIIIMRMQRSQAYEANTQMQRAENVKDNGLKLFEYLLFRNLGEQILIDSMNQVFNQYGEPSNYQMGVSPTKKKTVSPSKVPKANIYAVQSQTLVNLDGDRHHQISFEEKIQEQQPKKDVEIMKSPIKQIDSSMILSGLFTSIEKKMLGYEEENDQLQINKSKQLSEIQKIKINSNQFFSVQRLPKDQIHHEEYMEDDGLVLIEAGLNMVKDKDRKLKQNTMDVEFSPTKKRKKGVGAYPKRRQLIITGSSPYLQYLPDMMKKDKHNKKNMTPSHNQLPVSRKVL